MIDLSNILMIKASLFQFRGHRHETLQETLRLLHRIRGCLLVVAEWALLLLQDRVVGEVQSLVVESLEGLRLGVLEDVGALA